MERGVRHKVSIIGAGNVATHLAQALACANDVVQIYSRNLDNAARLASKIQGCEAIDDISKLSSNIDI
ncbi:MAG: NAD(P)-binding domain-containing protein, partial [Muribaculaceae bacterium]|nr:NAD(P)-binding domain-containing protein [Muribaculaceae bacterium]